MLRLILLYLLFNSSSVFATCDVYDYYGSLLSCESIINHGTNSERCFVENGAVKYSSCTTPAPTCNPSQVLDPKTQTCKADPASVTTDSVNYLGLGQSFDCSDGSVAYPPQTCPMSWFDYFTSEPGQSKTCPNGDIAVFPRTCFDALVSPVGEKIVEGLGLILQPSRGAVKLATYAIKEGGNLLGPTSSPTVLRQIEYTPPNGGPTKYGTIETPLPKTAVSEAVSSFAKDTTPASNSFRSQVTTKTNGLYTVDTNTGTLRVASEPLTSRPLSLNESLDVYSRFGVETTAGQLTPYIKQTYTPGTPEAVLQIGQDLSRSAINDPLDLPRFVQSSWTSSTPTVDSTTGQLNPGAPTPIQQPDPATSPFSGYTTPVTSTPTSTTTTSAPATSTKTQTTVDPQTGNHTETTTTTSTVNNSNGTQTTTTTVTERVIDPNGTVVSSTTKSTTTETASLTKTTTDYGAVPPVITYDNDYSLYQDWLKQAIPVFNYDASDWLPQLPNTGCNYEVHTTIFGRAFDLVPCAPLLPLRQILGWVFAVLSAWICFRVVFKTTS